MHFSKPLHEGRLLRRYKRFLADIELTSGEIVTAHCANPGAMLGLTEPGARVYLSVSDNPNRTLPYSWEMVESLHPASQNLWVGINTSHPNRLAEEAITQSLIAELTGYASMRREVKYASNSRIDLLLSHDDRPLAYVEVKNVHLMRQPGLAEFPDSVTTRGAKHLRDLSQMVREGHRAIMLFIIQMQATRFTIASDIDPAYAQAFRQARQEGVEAYAYTCQVSPEAIVLNQAIPIIEPES